MDNQIEEIKEVQKVVQVEEVKDTKEDKKSKKKKKKKVFNIILNIITTILAIIIVLEAVIGIVNMQKINNDEKPVWYLNKTVTETDAKTVTEYNLGLYKIVKTDTARETKTTLKPFFLAD